MKLQEISDYLIDSGLYSGKLTSPGHPYMCAAIDEAEELEKLSPKDAAKARGAIRTYLSALDPESVGDGNRILYFALRYAWEPHGGWNKPREEGLLAIYRNWAKRPYPPKPRAKAKANKLHHHLRLH